MDNKLLEMKVINTERGEAKMHSIRKTERKNPNKTREAEKLFINELQEFPEEKLWFQSAQKLESRNKFKTTGPTAPKQSRL